MLTLLANQQETLVKSYTFDYGCFYIFDFMMVSIINEGVVINDKLSDEILTIAQHHFHDNKPFGYISIRDNSFSLNPITYTKFSNMKQLKCFAIVSKKEIDFFNFKVEKRFMKNNLKIFFDKKSALLWVYQILQKPITSEL